MSTILQDNYWFSVSAEPDKDISNCLRFRNAQSLTKSWAIDTSVTTVSSCSMWIKMTDVLGANYQYILSGGPATSVRTDFVNWLTDCTFHLDDGLSGVSLITPGVYRDPAAWYHVLINYDSNTTTGIATRTLYINGQEAATDTNTVTAGTDPGFHPNWLANAAAVSSVSIGDYAFAAGYNFSGYLAEMHVSDGAIYPPTTFGQYNSQGVWVPKEVTGINYGSSGWYLNFSNNSNIGQDSSGNGNDFTANGFTTTPSPGVGTDALSDSPTNNQVLLNGLDAFDQSLAGTGDGAKQVVNLTGYIGGPRFCKIPSSGKYYWELGSVVNISAEFVTLGFDIQAPVYNVLPAKTFYIGVSNGAGGVAIYNNQVAPPASDYILTEAQSLSPAFTKQFSSFEPYWPGYVQVQYGFELNCDVSPPTIQLTRPGTGPYTTGISLLTAGVDDKFITVKTFNQGNALYLEPGEWAGTPPAGYVKLSTKNLPTAPIPNGSDHFEPILDTGANILTASQAKFSNGLWWIKDRDNANQFQFVDSINTSSQTLSCPANTRGAYVAPSGNSVAWCWATPANGINTTSGFSITQGAGNVAHGLGSAPDFALFCAPVGTAGSLGAGIWTYNVGLGTGLAYDIASQVPRSTATWTVNNTEIGLAEITGSITRYCWTSVPGYSAFGTYAGNGSADGPFVYTDFKPAFLWRFNPTSAQASMVEVDSTGTNPLPFHLLPCLTNAEVTIPKTGTGADQVDWCSNGFKVRSTNTASNFNGSSIVYAAFAENPFGGSNISPATAR